MTDNNMNINEESESRFSSGKILLLLMFLAAVIRIAAALTRPMIQLDETAYVRMAENLVNGQGLLEISGSSSTHFSPLLPMFIAGLGTVLQDYVLSGYIMVIIFGSLILFPVYLLGKELVSERVGLMAAALMAAIPLFVDYSSRLYSESVYIFFLLMAILFGKHMLRGCRVPCSILSGSSLGLAYLANPSAVFYLLAVLLLAVGVSIVNGVWRQMAKAVLIFLVSFCVYALPYVIYLHGETGTWTFSGKNPGNIYTATHGLRHNTLEWEMELLALDEERQEMFIDTLIMDSDAEANPVTFFIKHPVEGMKNLARQTNIFLSQELSRVIPLWLLPLLGLGLFASGWTRKRAAGVGYLLIMLTPAFIILTFYAHSRFFMPFVPLVLIWVAQGWSKLEDWGNETIDMSLPAASRQKSHRWAPWLIGIAVMLPVLSLAGFTVAGQDYPVVNREAGEYLAGLPEADKKIMSRQYASAYYAGGTSVLLPYASYEDTNAFAGFRDVDYMVISKKEIEEGRPQLERLLEGDTSHPEWELVERLRQGTEDETLIFRLGD